jgi:hypothetical protein
VNLPPSLSAPMRRAAAKEIDDRSAQAAGGPLPDAFEVGIFSWYGPLETSEWPSPPFVLPAGRASYRGVAADMMATVRH